MCLIFYIKSLIDHFSSNVMFFLEISDLYLDAIKFIVEKQIYILRLFQLY